MPVEPGAAARAAPGALHPEARSGRAGLHWRRRVSCTSAETSTVVEPYVRYAETSMIRRLPQAALGAAEHSDEMSDQNVEIQVTIKLVDQGHYEFSYPYGPAHGGGELVPGIPGKVVPTGSSMIAPGFAMPVEQPRVGRYAE
jgi:hypothetical protein